MTPVKEALVLSEFSSLKVGGQREKKQNLEEEEWEEKVFEEIKTEKEQQKEKMLEESKTEKRIRSRR